MKRHQVAGGAAVPLLLLISCLSVLSAHKRDYFIRVQASIASATAALSAPCPPLCVYLSLSPSPLLPLSLAFSLLPVPGPQTAWLNTQANVSLFKETQVVDTLAMGQAKKMKSYCGALWLHLASTSVNPHYGGPTWTKSLPTRRTEIWARSPTLPPQKNPLIPRRDPFLFHFINQGRRGRGSSFGVEKLMLALAPIVKVPFLGASVHTAHLQQEQQKPGAHLNAQN